ncbi:MAG: bifunctional riboflavin kinase/FAD synthetase [Thermodesulfovibrionales bacterium]|nr:bifunctional riboflavin kinase/FAD synthetase [Thermodesulfovibrionales bacterium]
MEIIRGLEALNESYPNTVLTIGNFDGLHLGHQKILLMVIRRSEEIKGTSMTVTFEPHPMKVIAPEREIKLLTTLKERARLMEAMGIRVLLCINFNKEFSDLLPDDFIEDVLVKKIGAKEVVVGKNYAFGKNRKGTTELLRRRGRKYGFSVKVVRNVRVHGDVVSSSKIRSLLLEGKVFEASTFLGRAYPIEGNVIKGTGRGGKLLHIPTANITTPNELVPKEGVYAVRVGFKGRFFDGVANIGRKPTFGDSDMSYEAHLFNFSGNLLRESLRVYFIDWIRSQRFFPDVLSLEKQIRDDIEHAKEILSRKKPKLI